MFGSGAEHLQALAGAVCYNKSGVEHAKTGIDDTQVPPRGPWRGIRVEVDVVRVVVGQPTAASSSQQQLAAASSSHQQPAEHKTNKTQ